jgi:hypothetical protein
MKINTFTGPVNKLPHYKVSVRRSSLTAEQTQRCRKTYPIIKPYFNDCSFEYWENGFCHDANVDHELSKWEAIVAALTVLRDKWPSRSKAERQRHFILLVGATECVRYAGPDPKEKELWDYLWSLIPAAYKTPPLLIETPKEMPYTDIVKKLPTISLDDLVDSMNATNTLPDETKKLIFEADIVFAQCGPGHVILRGEEYLEGVQSDSLMPDSEITDPVKGLVIRMNDKEKDKDIAAKWAYFITEAVKDGKI